MNRKREKGGGKNVKFDSMINGDTLELEKILSSGTGFHPIQSRFFFSFLELEQLHGTTFTDYYTRSPLITQTPPTPIHDRNLFAATPENYYSFLTGDRYIGLNKWAERRSLFLSLFIVVASISNNYENLIEKKIP